MDVLYKKRKIKIPVKKLGFFGRFYGLMFRTRETSCLLFEFSKDVTYVFHSYFVFFPFMILWLDSKNNIIDSALARPFKFKISTEKPFRKVIEVPVNYKNLKIIEFLDD